MENHTPVPHAHPQNHEHTNLNLPAFKFVEFIFVVLGGGLEAQLFLCFCLGLSVCLSVCVMGGVCTCVFVHEGVLGIGSVRLRRSYSCVSVCGSVFVPVYT